MADLLAGAALAAFLWAGAVCLYRLLRRGAEAPAPSAPAPQPCPSRQLAVGAAALGWGLALLAALCAAASLRAPGVPVWQTIRAQFCGGLDARHYLNLARWGYGAGEAGFAEQYLMIVFFPLWPLLLRPFALLGCDLWLAGTGLNLALTAAGTVLLYRCAVRLLCAGGDVGASPAARRQTALPPDAPALFACAVQLALPGSFFFVLPQTEALFFCLNFAFLDALQCRRCTLAGLWGLLAALCRANGALLAGYAVLWLWQESRAGRGRLRPAVALARALPVLGPAAGTGLYLALNRAVYGDPLRFMAYQRQHWHNGFCLFPTALRTMYREILGADPGRALYLGVWTAALILAEAALLALAARRLPPDWLGLGLAGFVLMNGQTWLISAQRYALGMPVLPLAAAAVCFGAPRRAGAPGRAGDRLCGKAPPGKRIYRAGGGAAGRGERRTVPPIRGMAAAAALCALLALNGVYFAGFAGGAPIY